MQEVSLSLSRIMRQKCRVPPLLGEIIYRKNFFRTLLLKAHKIDAVFNGFWFLWKPRRLPRQHRFIDSLSQKGIINAFNERNFIGKGELIFFRSRIKGRHVGYRMCHNWKIRIGFSLLVRIAHKSEGETVLKSENSFLTLFWLVFCCQSGEDIHSIASIADFFDIDTRD